MSSSSNTQHFEASEEERRHHQTAPMKAFGPSVLVTAAAATPPLTSTAATAGHSGAPAAAAAANAGAATTASAADAHGIARPTPTLRHGDEDIQSAPLRAFESAHGAGTSASNQNSRTQSPTRNALKLSFAGIDSTVPAVGSSSNNNEEALLQQQQHNSANNNPALGSSSSQCLEEYNSMNDVSDRTKQLKPLTVAKSPRGKN